MKRWLIPSEFYKRAGKVLPWLTLGCVLTLTYGLVQGLLFAPNDYQQGSAVKIIYLHVPFALLSLTIYTCIGGLSVIYLVWKIKLADVIAQVSAPIGALITALALFTGSVWGKPMWGAWWIWDARLTSELILLFLYLGYIALRATMRDLRNASNAAAILAVVGLIDIPIIHFSVDWWHTLHQSASISRFAKPAIATPILYPLLLTMLGLYLFYAVVVLYAARTQILWRERKASWVREILNV